MATTLGPLLGFPLSKLGPTPWVLNTLRGFFCLLSFDHPSFFCPLPSFPPSADLNFLALNLAMLGMEDEDDEPLRFLGCALNMSLSGFSPTSFRNHSASSSSEISAGESAEALNPSGRLSFDTCN